MKKFYKIMFMVLFGANTLYAGNGLSQPHLLSTVPSLNDNNVPPNTTLSFTFDSSIMETSIKPRTIVLKQKAPNRHKIKGNVSIVNENTLIFAPQQQLEKGEYVIKVKPLKLKKENTPEIEPKTKWQKFIAWLCGLVYDDITDCPLCQYVCDIQKHSKTKAIQYTFEVKEDAPTLTQLTANTTRIELSEHNSTQVQITAKFDDNRSEDVTQKATYTSSDSSVDVDKGIITTNQEGSATVTVSYGGKDISIQVEVYEMIDGHLLPHEPDNPDDRLLGVDENNNSVRDEVERWIYKTEYLAHPEINRVIAMQEARFYQMSLIDPSNKDDKVYQNSKRSMNCDSYYTESRNIPLAEAGRPLSFDLIFLDKYFNTRERLKTYRDYNRNLGIRVFTLTPTRLLNVGYCDKNIDLLP
ncbi:MAG: Ig-like domain-containing protein [Sulfurovum sp.]|nr:Ig-like domain-containing protein [Sulfurovum sp.]